MGIISSGNTVIDNGAIDANEVNTTQIANDAVTADKLAHTAVTPGSYTLSSITVDQQGRITSASSGSAAAAVMNVNIVGLGPASGTYTQNTANQWMAFVSSGGGGGGGGGYYYNRSGGIGGKGALGVFKGNFNAPSSFAYAIGAGGNAGQSALGQGQDNGGDGGAGGTTNVANLFSISGGNGGGGSRPGANGNAGNPGTVNSGTATYSTTAYNSAGGNVLGVEISGGGDGPSPANGQTPNLSYGNGTAGGRGGLIFYDNR